MAKGRRLISSRSERLLGVSSNHRYGYGYPDEVADVAELGEEEVWSMVEDSPENHLYTAGYGEWTPRATVESGRQIQRGNNRHVGGLSLAFEDNNNNNNISQATSSSRGRIIHQSSWGPPYGSERHVATSAPVNVPDWSKILRVNSVESIHDSDDDDRTGDSGIEPPHEYLARSRKMNAFSVYEGVGRTLKGRDMSRVRDAVWSQTGFEG